MHAVVVDDRDVAGLPVVAHAVVDLVALAIEDVEGRLVHVAVLLRLATRGVLLQVDVEHLGDAVLRLDVVTAEGLRAVGEANQLALPDAGHGPQASQFLTQVVVALQGPDKNPVLLGVVVRLVDDDLARWRGRLVLGHTACSPRPRAWAATLHDWRRVGPRARGKAGGGGRDQSIVWSSAVSSARLLTPRR